MSLSQKEKRLLVIGPNGVGKSNLLEAVELLGSLRSHRSSSDHDLVYWHHDTAIVSAINSTYNQALIKNNLK